MSLRTRLLLASGLLLGLVVIGVLVVLRNQRSFLTDQVDRQLESAQPLARFPLPNRGGPGEPTPPDDASVPSDAPFSSLFVGYIDGDQVVTTLQGQLLDDIPEIDVRALEATGSQPFTVDGRDGSTRFRAMLLPFPGSERVAVIALPLDEVDSAVSRLGWTLGGGAAVIAAVLLLAVWWVERLGLRPIGRITAAADLIAQGDRTQRVLGSDRRTEAGKLATAFNLMLDERDQTEERLRRFIADASHELRTPLTSISGYLEVYREGGFRTEQSLNDIVRRMTQESSRMHDLIEDLLLLANLDQRRPLRRERVDLGRLLRDAATDAGVLQPTRPIAVDLPGHEPLEILGDNFRLQQVVSALVNNALTYTDLACGLRLSARSSLSGAAIVIEDDGPGLHPEQAERVFDRFFRGEQSRSRRSGGSGLGLAIARSIVEAHSGTIRLHTAPGAGCRFTIALPSTDLSRERLLVPAPTARTEIEG